MNIVPDHNAGMRTSPPVTPVQPYSADITYHIEPVSTEIPRMTVHSDNSMEFRSESTTVLPGNPSFISVTGVATDQLPRPTIGNITDPATGVVTSHLTGITIGNTPPNSFVFVPSPGLQPRVTISEREDHSFVMVVGVDCGPDVEIAWKDPDGTIRINEETPIQNFKDAVGYLFATYAGGNYTPQVTPPKTEPEKPSVSRFNLLVGDTP